MRIAVRAAGRAADYLAVDRNRVPEEVDLAAVGEPDARGEIRPDRCCDAPVIRGQVRLVACSGREAGPAPAWPGRMAATVATAAISTSAAHRRSLRSGHWQCGRRGPPGPQRPCGIASAPQRVNGDLGAAGALLTGAEARRRGGPSLSAAITRSGREGYRFTPDGRHRSATRRPAVPPATPASLAGKPCFTGPGGPGCCGSRDLARWAGAARLRLPGERSAGTDRRTLHPRLVPPVAKLPEGTTLLKWDPRLRRAN